MSIINPISHNKNSTPSFTIDDTLTLSDTNVLSVSSPTRGIISREDFDALPEEEQNRGLYLIPGPSSGVGSSQEIYSEEETVIGTWIDGKPLYRKCKKLGDITLSRGVWSKIDDAPENIDTLVKLVGGFTYNKEKMYVPFLVGSSGMVFTIQDTNISAYTSDGNYANNGKNYFYILKYTKTTDEVKS